MKWRQATGQINAVTAREQRYVISYFTDAMGDRLPRQIGASDLERWLGSMQGRLNPGTIRHRWRTAFGFLEWLVDEGHMRRNPARRIPSPKVPRRVHRNLRADQAAALHDACVDDRERLIIALGFQLAMRRGEIARAQIGDFDFVDMTVRIVGKGGHERVVPITEDAAAAITTYLATLRVHAGPLVRDREGVNGLSPGYVGDLWREVAYRAGVKARPWDGVATHSARHTAGTDVAHRSKDPVVTRDFLGHASLSTTDGYIGAVGMGRMREATEGRHYQETA